MQWVLSTPFEGEGTRGRGVHACVCDCDCDCVCVCVCMVFLLLTASIVRCMRSVLFGCCFVVFIEIHSNGIATEETETHKGTQYPRLTTGINYGEPVGERCVTIFGPNNNKVNKEIRGECNDSCSLSLSKTTTTKYIIITIIISRSSFKHTAAVMQNKTTYLGLKRS